MFHVNLFSPHMWVHRGELFIMCPSTVRNLARAHHAHRCLILCFGKCRPDAGSLSSHVSWLSVTEVVLAFNPVEFQREWIFPVPSTLIKITLSTAIGQWWNLEAYPEFNFDWPGSLDWVAHRPLLFDLLGLLQEALVPPNQPFVDQSKLPWGGHREDWVLRGQIGICTVWLQPWITSGYSHAKCHMVIKSRSLH